MHVCTCVYISCIHVGILPLLLCTCLYTSVLTEVRGFCQLLYTLILRQDYLQNLELTGLDRLAW